MVVVLHGARLTSPPPEPRAVAGARVVLQQLEQVKLVIVVFQVCLVQHRVPVHPVLTVHLGL